MNKQEFQQKIKDMKPPKFFTAVTLGEAYEAGFEEAKGNALYNSCFLNEPEKPVVPQAVMEYYEFYKDTLTSFAEWFEEAPEGFSSYFDKEKEVQKWLYDVDYETQKQHELALAFLIVNGPEAVEVEKEKLYTVEIPSHGNPDHIVLRKNVDGEVCIDCYFSDEWRDYKCAQLTEAEIKKDHDWAWKYAEEAEE